MCIIINYGVENRGKIGVRSSSTLIRNSVWSKHDYSITITVLRAGNNDQSWWRRVLEYKLPIHAFYRPSSRLSKPPSDVKILVNQKKIQFPILVVSSILY